MGKIFNNIKEYKSLIIVAIVFILAFIGMVIFTIFKPVENPTNTVQYFDTPDRIV